jgi:hypothetical protein
MIGTHSMRLCSTFDRFGKREAMEALGAALGRCAAEPTECTWSEASESEPESEAEDDIGECTPRGRGGGGRGGMLKPGGGEYLPGGGMGI